MAEQTKERPNRTDGAKSMTTHDNDKAHDAAERELMDAEGENRAVRCFLTLYGGAGAPTIKAMRDHLCMSGFGGYWPKWTEADRYGCHLTKAGAQDWLRYLFNRESSAPDGWVSVSDRLPEPHTTVLVWREDSGPFLAKRIAYCDVEDAGSDSDEIAWLADQYGWQEGSEEPTHWMPTPPAP